MDVRNADSLPRVGVCFFRDESLSALAVVYRGVEGGLSVFCVSDPVPAACCQLPPVFRFPDWITIGSRGRKSRLMAGMGSAFDIGHAQPTLPSDRRAGRYRDPTPPVPSPCCVGPEDRRCPSVPDLRTPITSPRSQGREPVEIRAPILAKGSAFCVCQGSAAGSFGGRSALRPSAIPARPSWPRRRAYHYCSSA